MKNFREDDKNKKDDKNIKDKKEDNKKKEEKEEKEDVKQKVLKLIEKIEKGKDKIINKYEKELKGIIDAPKDFTINKEYNKLIDR